MTQISFGKKTAIATSEAQQIDISGLDISHLGSKNSIYMQGTVMAADKLYKAGIGVGIPADPVYIDKVIKVLEKLRDQLTPTHIR